MTIDDATRLALCEQAIEICRANPDDPRAPAALQEYLAQAEQIRQRMAQPTDQVIALGPLKAMAKVKAA